MIAYRFGYDITTDLHHGFILVWGKRRKRMLSIHWNWPHLVWYNRDWALDEAGHIQGLPVYRRVKKRWLIRAWVWPISIQVGNWRMNHWVYLGKKRPPQQQYKYTSGGTRIEPIVDNTYYD